MPEIRPTLIRSAEEITIQPLRIGWKGLIKPRLNVLANNVLRGVVGGLSETSNQFDRNDRGNAIEKFQPLTESRLEGERDLLRPDMVGRGDNYAGDYERFTFVLCGKSFAFRQDLAGQTKHKHENVSYPCPTCLKSFSTISNLNRHWLSRRGKSSLKAY